MPATVSHVLSATTPDDPAFEIRPSHWNSSHLMTLNAVGSEISNAFGNAGGVTFGYDGTNVTAAAGTAAPSPVNVSAGTTSNNLGSVIFADSNGVSFGLGTGASSRSITATVKTDYQTSGAYLTTAMLSNAATISNIKVSGGTASQLRSDITFVDSNGVSWGLDTGANAGKITATVKTDYLTTAMLSNAATISNIKVSAGTASQLRSDITFVDSNGVSFGLDTGANAGKITATVKTDYLTSQSNQAASASNGSFTFQTLGFSNANNVTFGTSAGSIVSASVAAQSNQSAIKGLGASNTGNTAGNTGISTGIDWVIAGTNQATISESTAGGGPNTLWINVTTAAQTNQSAIKGFGASNTGNTAGNTGISTGVDWVLAGSTNITVSESTVGGGPNTLWLSVPNVAAGNVNFSAGTTSSNIGAVTFSNSNGVSFGLGTGANAGVITASAAGGGGVVIANSQTTFTSGTVTLSEGGGAITIASSTAAAGVQKYNFSVPATSSLVGTSGISISTNGSTISVLQLALQEYDPYPLYNGISTAFATQAVGAWFVAPFYVDQPIAGGRINRLIVNGAVGSILRATTSASFQAATTGTKSGEYQYSNSVVLYSLGAGTNSTRLESFWSNMFSFDLKHSVSITSGVGATTLFVGESGTISYLSAIDSAGNTTTNSFNSNGNATSGGSSINSTALSSILGSVRNMLSGSMQIPVGFNTTINPGNYWMAQAWSTNSTTAGSSESMFSQASSIGVLMAQLSVYRMFPQTTTNVSSQYYPGRGVYSASQSNPPTTMAFSDIRTWASDIVPYFNFVNSQISV
jgi:hypothetical protein